METGFADVADEDTLLLLERQCGDDFLSCPPPPPPPVIRKPEMPQAKVETIATPVATLNKTIHASVVSMTGRIPAAVAKSGSGSPISSVSENSLSNSQQFKTYSTLLPKGRCKREDFELPMRHISPIRTNESNDNNPAKDRDDVIFVSESKSSNMSRDAQRRIAEKINNLVANHSKVMVSKLHQVLAPDVSAQPLISKNISRNTSVMTSTVPWVRRTSTTNSCIDNVQNHATNSSARTRSISRGRGMSVRTSNSVFKAPVITHSSHCRQQKTSILPKTTCKDKSSEKKQLLSEQERSFSQEDLELDNWLANHPVLDTLAPCIFMVIIMFLIIWFFNGLSISAISRSYVK